MIFRALGHDNIPLERLPDAFASAVTQILTMREALSRPSNEGSEIGELKKQALAALDDGRFDEATRLLNEMRTLERKVSERLRRAADESRADWLAGLQSEAETSAMLARAALAQRDVTRAFDRFEEGLGVLAPTDPERRWWYAFAAAGALYELGRSAGLNDALAAAIRLYEDALAAASREHVPLDWAVTQNNLGCALATLGEREGGTARLEQGVEAFQAALLEYTRERVPLDWAGTQNNLGEALEKLGGRESGTAKLEEAVKAFQAALLELTTEGTTNWHEDAQSNLTRTLALLEQRRKQ